VFLGLSFSYHVIKAMKTALFAVFATLLLSAMAAPIHGIPEPTVRSFLDIIRIKAYLFF